MSLKAGDSFPKDVTFSYVKFFPTPPFLPHHNGDPSHPQ